MLRLKNIFNEKKGGWCISLHESEGWFVYVYQKSTSEKGTGNSRLNILRLL